MGSEVSLTCVARGNPLPDVLWTKGNSNIIPPEDTFEYSDEGRGETTAVAVVREGGIYFCHIFNAHDDDLARATVETSQPLPNTHTHSHTHTHTHTHTHAQSCLCTLRRSR